MSRADPNHEIRKIILSASAGKICHASRLVAISKPTAASGEEQRVLLFVDGEGEAVQVDDDGVPFMVSWIMDKDAAKSIIAEFEGHGVDLVFDYEHQTLGDEYSSPTGQAPAAGWIRRNESRSAFEYVEGEGLYGLVTWTKRALEMIASSEYRYHSPVFAIDDDTGRVSAIHSFALTNKPATVGIPALAAKEKSAAARMAIRKRIIAQLKGTSMEPFAMILAELGITEQFASPEATLQAILTAIRELMAPKSDEEKPEQASPEEVKEAAKLIQRGVDNATTVTALAKLLGVDTKKSDFRATLESGIVTIQKSAKSGKAVANTEIATLKTQLEESVKTVSTLQEKDEARDLHTFLEGGRKSGKIVTTTEKTWIALWNDDQEEAAKTLKGAPVIVATGGKTHVDPGATKEFTGDDVIDNPENWDDKRKDVYGKALAKQKEIQATGKPCSFEKAYTIVTGRAA